MSNNGSFTNGRGKSPTGVIRTDAEDAVIREMESRTSRTVERRQEMREETVIVESKMIEEGSRSVSHLIFLLININVGQ